MTRSTGQRRRGRYRVAAVDAPAEETAERLGEVLARVRGRWVAEGRLVEIELGDRVLLLTREEVAGAQVAVGSEGLLPGVGSRDVDRE